MGTATFISLPAEAQPPSQPCSRSPKPTSTTSPSPSPITSSRRKTSLPKNVQHLNQSTLSITDSPIASGSPAVPSESLLDMITPADLLLYKERLEEAYIAMKEHRRPKFIPLQHTERIRMSSNSFQELYKFLGCGELDNRYPSVSYNSRTRTGIIQWMPSGVHETLAAPFLRSQGIATQNLQPDVLDRMQVVGPQLVGAFGGAYEGSKKEPDVLFKYRQQNRYVSYSAVVEVGMSETYEELIEDVKMWIEGNHDIRTAILIKVEEDPRYLSPTSKLDDDQIVALDFPYYRDLNPSMVVLEDPHDTFGPLQLNGLIWVGKTSVFLEVWKRDETTGGAKQHEPRMHFVPNNGIPELNFKLSDFYPIDAASGGNIRFPLTFDELRRYLEMAREELAVERCRDMLVSLAKRQDNIDDVDYTP